MKNIFLCGFIISSISCSYASDAPLRHNGGLIGDTERVLIREHLSHHEEPWYSTFKKLRESKYDRSDYLPHPEKTVIRGTAPHHLAENYSSLFHDTAAAYALANDWRLTGDRSKGARRSSYSDLMGADDAKKIDGTSDKYLAAGLYGYQLAIAAETLRSFEGWPVMEQEMFKAMLLRVFVPMNQSFLKEHNGQSLSHYWANWDLANDTSLMAIGIYTHQRSLYEMAKDYYLRGSGNGSLIHAVWKEYPHHLAQWQESGRDQGHTMLGLGLAGTLCQLAWMQGDDIFSADHNRLLSAARYIARYNMGESVPYTPYSNGEVVQEVISDKGRGEQRPIWFLYYSHYVQLKHEYAPEIEKMVKRFVIEGGGGDYGSTSGGFDQLGYGSLFYSMKEE